MVDARISRFNVKIALVDHFCTAKLALFGQFQHGKSITPTDLRSTSLREAMGTYYDYFSGPISLSPTYTQLYKDFFSNGKIFNQKKLKTFST